MRVLPGVAPLLAVSLLTRRLQPPSSLQLGQLGDQLAEFFPSRGSSLEKRLLQQPTLANFEALERSRPAPKNLLYTSSGKDSLQGRWVLSSTIAAGVGNEVSDETTAVPGAVNASGLMIDTSAKRVPVQEIDFAAGRIGNEIRFEILGISGMARVAGGLETDDSNGQRALVSFDSLELFLLGDESEAVGRIARLGWLFSLVRRLRPALANGDESTSWLDTTYISERMRLGRGNKGSIFVLEKQEGIGPLAAWPL